MFFDGSRKSVLELREKVCFGEVGQKPLSLLIITLVFAANNKACL